MYLCFLFKKERHTTHTQEEKVRERREQENLIFATKDELMKTSDCVKFLSKGEKSK